VDSSDVRRWFGEYLDAFAACGRGEKDTDVLLAYYGVPLVLTTDGGSIALTSNEQVVTAVQQQVDGMRAADYNRSEILGSEVTVLNSTSSLPGDVLASQERRQRDRPAHRDLSCDRRSGWPPLFSAGGS